MQQVYMHMGTHRNFVIPDSYLRYTSFERPSAIQQRAIMPVIKGNHQRSSAASISRLIKVLRPRCHCSGTVWHRQDCHIFDFGASEAGPECQAVPGTHSRTDP